MLISYKWGGEAVYDKSQPLSFTLGAGFYPALSSMALGCSTTESIEVKKDCFVDIPNVFTPNGDGVNDYFFPRKLLSEGVKSFSMQVFSRWGEKVFETDRVDGRGWDGKGAGREQPAGVYVYIVELVFDGGRREQYEGNVTLIH